MLPSEAPMPPWAATVCERVGNTLDSTQTDRPARASCSEARIPEPPAPTITTSKRRRGREFLIAAILLHSPENLRSVARTREQPDDRQRLKKQARANGLHIVHPDVADTDPRVIEQREQRDKRSELHPLRGEDRGPAFVREIARAEEPHEQDHRVDRHHAGRNALGEPVAQTVMCADDETLRTDSVISCHFLKNSEQFCRECNRKKRRHDENDDGGLLAAFLRDRAVRVHHEVTDAGAEVKQEGPRENERDELDDDVGEKTFEDLETQFGSQALIEEVQQERKKNKKQTTA